MYGRQTWSHLERVSPVLVHACQCTSALPNKEQISLTYDCALSLASTHSRTMPGLSLANTVRTRTIGCNWFKDTKVCYSWTSAFPRYTVSYDFFYNTYNISLKVIKRNLCKHNSLQYELNSFRASGYVAQSVVDGFVFSIGSFQSVFYCSIICMIWVSMLYLVVWITFPIWTVRWER